jgi:7,8-dihydroneopterin aldolase/epimerase/oxygenase
MGRIALEGMEFFAFHGFYDEEQKIVLVPARLLEHLGHRIIDRIYHRFPLIRKIKINVYKFNPPLGGICRRAKITLLESR